MKNQKVTIHTIAASLNITASTVSRALNGNKRISQKTRDLVNRTAAEMGYKPNHMASNLRKGKGNLIGVIIPRINRHFFSHAIAGMEAITNPAGYNLMICQTNESEAKETDGLQTLINNRAEGVIMSISNETRNGAHIQSAIDGGMPVVLFDRILKDLNIDNVVNDNFAGAYEATKHLIQQGYKNIVHFSGPLHINVYEQRLNGYKTAMAEANLNVTSEMVFDNIITRFRGEELAQKLIAKDKLPDAIFSSSDYSALGALITFKNAGINIPQDIGIVGFANELFTELIDPALTSLEQYSEDIGKSAAKLLIERIENKNNKEVTSSMSFKPKLIIRDSSQRNIIN